MCEDHRTLPTFQVTLDHTCIHTWRSESNLCDVHCAGGVGEGESGKWGRGKVDGGKAVGDWEERCMGSVCGGRGVDRGRGGSEWVGRRSKERGDSEGL